MAHFRVAMKNGKTIDVVASDIESARQHAAKLAAGFDAALRTMKARKVSPDQHENHQAQIKRIEAERADIGDVATVTPVYKDTASLTAEQRNAGLAYALVEDRRSRA